MPKASTEPKVTKVNSKTEGPGVKVTMPRKPAPSQGALDASKKAQGRPLLFPEVKNLRNFGASALTYPAVRTLLGFESEEEFAARIAAAGNAKDPSIKLDGTGIKFREDELLKERVLFFSHEGARYCTWNNAGNRPFRLDWALTIAQDILQRQWAGPITMPELEEHTYGGAEPYTMADGTVLKPGDKVKLPRGTVNGEAIQISRTGLVKSGQHRMIGFLLAVLEWRKRPHKYPGWTSEPVLETIVTYGVSDHPDVTTTMDNNLSRTEADSFYASGTISKVLPEDKVAKLNQRERQEVCRQLQAAVDFLWQRCGKGQYMFQTHSATQKFLDDHPRLYKAVRHIWTENSSERGRPLSLGLKIPPGQMAAALYMMASGKSDLTKWDAQTGTERLLDMSLWGAAEDYFTLLAKREGQHRAVIGEIQCLVDDPESPTKGVGKLVVLARGWEALGSGGKIRTRTDHLPDGTEILCCDDLAPEIGERDGTKIIINATGFGGIDRGPALREPDPEEPSEAEVAAAKERLDRAKAPKPEAPAKEESPDDVRKKHIAAAAAKNGTPTKAPGEVAKPAPKPVGKDGKPLPVKVKK